MTYEKKTKDNYRGKREGMVKYVEHWQTKYTYEKVLKMVKKMQSELNKYLKDPDNYDERIAVPTISYMCTKHMKIGRENWYQLLDKFKDTEIPHIHNECISIMESLLQQKALKNEVNGSIAQLTLKTIHKWVESQHVKVDQDTKISGNINININRG